MAAYICAMVDPTALQSFLQSHSRIVVLTGAGCSTNSGIPDYRDSDGQWKRTPPVTYQAFMGTEETRRRYWARSMVGWRRFGRAAQFGQGVEQRVLLAPQQRDQQRDRHQRGDEQQGQRHEPHPPEPSTASTST